MGKRKTHEEYVNELAEKNPDIEVLEEYQGSQINILHKCKIDGYEWSARPNNILHGTKCPKCQLIKQSEFMHKTHDKYVVELSMANQNIDVIEAYSGALVPIKHRCKIDNYEWLVRPSDVLHGKGCPKCAGKWRRTQIEYIEDVKNLNQNIDVVGLFVDRKTKVLHMCLACGVEFETAPDNILRGSGCPKCGAEKARKTQTKTQEEYEQDVYDISPNIEVMDQYIDSHTKIKHRCKLDGCEWYALPSNILKGRGCPKCNQSHGERDITLWLNYYGIKFQTQHTFDDCKDRRALPFDFYLPDYNVCIEFDGRQHFEPVDFAGKGEEWALSQFAIIKTHDEIKNVYCKLKGIHLLRIPYFKNVEEELDNFYSFNIVTQLVI